MTDTDAESDSAEPEQQMPEGLENILASSDMSAEEIAEELQEEAERQQEETEQLLKEMGSQPEDEKKSLEDVGIGGLGLDVGMADLGSCAACQKPIPEELEECPHCGNHPAGKAKWSSTAIMVAGLCLLLVFPPLGVLVFLVGLVARLGMIITDYPASEYDF